MGNREKKQNGFIQADTLQKIMRTVQVAGCLTHEHKDEKDVTSSITKYTLTSYKPVTIAVSY
jgi:hypothetical protein